MEAGSAGPWVWVVDEREMVSGLHMEFHIKYIFGFGAIMCHLL